MKTSIYGLLAIGAGGALAGMYHAAGGVSGWLNLFTLWVLLPYLVLLLAARWAVRKPIVVTVLVVAILVAGFGSYAYYEALVVQTSSTSALVFVTVPLWQLIAAGVAFLTAFATRRRGAMADTPPAGVD